MSKAVLVMDMPERCVKCPLLLTLPQKDGLALCIARPKSGQEEYNPNNEKTWRPDWCPLQELPERSDHPEHCDNGRFDAGWNGCLDAIEGGAHGKEQSE